MLTKEAKKSDRGHTDAKVRLPLVGSDLASHKSGRRGSKEDGERSTGSLSSDCRIENALLGYYPARDREKWNCTHVPSTPEAERPRS